MPTISEFYGLSIYMYNNYVSKLNGEISSKEVNEFNEGLENIKDYF